MNTDTLAGYLRAATRDHHRALDQHPLLRPLVAADLDLAAYGRALAALYGPQCRLELAVRDGLACLDLDYPVAPRSRLLAVDLAALGLEAPGLLANGPLWLHSPPRLVGALYVLEGARLGARLIGARVRERLGPEVPLRFFGHGHDAAGWAAFGAFAEGQCAESEWEQAATAARDTFGLFKACLDGFLERTPNPVVS